MESLNIYWQDRSFEPELRAEVYSFIQKGCENESEGVSLSKVNDLLSGLDGGDPNFGFFEEREYKLRIFELNETPFRSEENIFAVKHDENYILRPPPNEFDYLILDISETKLKYFLPMAEVVATIDYSSEGF